MTVDTPVVRLLPETEPLHGGAYAAALAEVTALRDRILRGEITEFVWAGLTPDEEIITCLTETLNAHMRIAALTRLLHRCNLDMDKAATPA